MFVSERYTRDFNIDDSLFVILNSKSTIGDFTVKLLYIYALVSGQYAVHIFSKNPSTGLCRVAKTRTVLCP